MSATIDSTLKQISRLTEEEAAQALAAKLGLPYTQLDGYPFNLETLKLVPLEVVESRGYGCYLRTNSAIKVAVVHPEDEVVMAEMAAQASQWGKEVEVSVISLSSLRAMVTTYLQLLNQEKTEADAHVLQVKKEEAENYFHIIKRVEDIQTYMEGANITTLLDVLLAGAVNVGASDLHLEPGEENASVRLRIDGVLQLVGTLPTPQLAQVVSRIKVVAKMTLDQHSAAQDGRFSLQDRGVPADVRVSIIPTGYGEGIVMRILRQDMKARTLHELGFSDYNLNLITGALAKPYGMILVTGPTGSGKSTTLYALLQILNTPERKIITLEDPIEYRVAGLQQSQVEPDNGSSSSGGQMQGEQHVEGAPVATTISATQRRFGFAEGLRGALRQDPDVIMVGEIRDAETATLALNASMTGHLVLSTIHTNNAVSAYTRLLEMGIEPFLLIGSVQAIIAQRLVRQIDGGGIDGVEPGFKGRTVVGEVLIPNQELELLVNKRADQHTLEEVAIRSGMITLHEDGLDKVRRGVTTEDELRRVVGV